MAGSIGQVYSNLNLIVTGDERHQQLVAVLRFELGQHPVGGDWQGADCSGVAERLAYRGGDRTAGTGDTGFARTLGPQRVRRGRGVFENRRLDRGQVGRGGQQVVHEVR